MPEQFKTTIGGQAILEGIVMKGPDKSATVVRKADGELVVEEKPASVFVKNHKICSVPIIRGAVQLFLAMKDGVKAINFSASFIEDDPSYGEPSRFEKWLEKKIDSEKLEQVLMAVAMVFGIALPVGLFILLPTLVAGWLPTEHLPSIALNLIEGGIRITIFLLFMWAVSHMKDIHRTFQYHGAEHKSIHCYEAGMELTVENVRPFSKHHPRCGTSFLFVVMIISILVFSVVTWTNPWVRMALRIVLLPLVVGVSYEFNRYVGRHDNVVTRVLRAPGMALQRFTTFEPDDSMIEVALEALKRVIPEESGADRW